MPDAPPVAGRAAGVPALPGRAPRPEQCRGRSRRPRPAAAQTSGRRSDDGGTRGGQSERWSRTRARSFRGVPLPQRRQRPGRLRLQRVRLVRVRAARDRRAAHGRGAVPGRRTGRPRPLASPAIWSSSIPAAVRPHTSAWWSAATLRARPELAGRGADEHCRRRTGPAVTWAPGTGRADAARRRSRGATLTVSRRSPACDANPLLRRRDAGPCGSGGGCSVGELRGCAGRPRCRSPAASPA